MTVKISFIFFQCSVDSLPCHKFKKQKMKNKKLTSELLITMEKTNLFL